jgi:hypothetical protein
MTARAYKLASRKVSWLCVITFFAVSLPILGIVLFADDRISGHVSIDRSTVFLLSTPFLCGSFVAGAWVMDLIDRRIGLHCARCGRSLTLRCDPRKVVESGVCPGCHENVIDAA